MIQHDDVMVDFEVGGDAVTTTEDHPFWNATDGEWQGPWDFDEGDTVLADDGSLLVTGGLVADSWQTGQAYNLTVDDLHTYFVVVADEGVLVHNDCGTSLVYEANPKHGPVSRSGPRGEISRAPRGDCQAMLECSVQVGARVREGMEPETGLTAIFRQHRSFDGTEWWHGYVPGG